MPYICTKFHEEILHDFKVIEWKRNIAWNKQRGIFMSKLKVGLRKVGLWFFFSAHCLIIPYICTKFHEEILNGFKVKERTLKYCHLNFDLEVWPWPSLDRIDLWFLHIVLVWQIFKQSLKTRDPWATIRNKCHATFFLYCHRNWDTNLYIP